MSSTKDQSLPRALGIETSCDETAVAVLAGDGTVEVSLLASQAESHAPFGGVVPELASREHLRILPDLVAQAMQEVDGTVDLIAATAGPGLIGALLVGVRFAAAFAWARHLPLVAVDHLEGHQVSPFLSLQGEPAREIPARVLALVASGGHSSWYLTEQSGSRRLCRTRDDAAGEAFDKVAQALGLPYPGGPVVDRMARLGNPKTLPMPQPRLKDGTIDFSFSGLKSAAIRTIRRLELSEVSEQAPPTAAVDLLASFQKAVVEQLLKPLPGLFREHRPDLVTASGGVAANSLLRSRLQEITSQLGGELLLPPPALTTDNAAMIARAGQLAFARGEQHDPRRLDARARQAWQPPGMARARKTGAGSAGG